MLDRMESLAVLLVVCVVGASGLIYPYPENTCPGYLMFQELNGLAVGILEVPNDGSGEYLLSVNGSLSFQDNSRLKITMPDYNEVIKNPVQTLRYHLVFPSPRAYPRITSVIFNGRTLCTAPAFPVGVNGNTNVWASYKLTASIQKGVYGNMPMDYPMGQNNNPMIQKPAPSMIDDYIYFELPNTFMPGRNPSPKPPVVIQPAPAAKPSPNPPVARPPPVMVQPVSIPTPTKAPTVEPFTSPSIQPNCGVVLNSIPLVISNEPVAQSEFPWMTALHRYNDHDKNYNFLCTANLISEKHVISAGHCVNYEGLILYDVEELILIFGKTKLFNWARDGTIGYVQKISVHPNYEQGRAGHDIAIFTLTKPMTFSNNIYPICLWDSLSPPESGVVAGWGQITGNKLLHNVVPYKATMPLVDEEECENAHPFRVGLTSPFVFCAGSRDGTGPCGGDTGAGFMVQINGRHYLKGVVAHIETKNGTDCDLSSYVLFADIANEKDWIQSVMKE